MGVELFRLIANGAGPISMPSPGSLCYKRLRQVRRRIFQWRELAFLFLTLSDHFYAPSVAYDRAFPIFAGVAATMRGRHSRLDMQPLPSLAQSQLGANHSSSRSPMALKFLIALCEARRTASVPNSQLDLDSVLRMVCWWRNTKALHLVKQGGALQAKSGSCTSWTTELPIGALTSNEDFSTYLVFEGGV